MSVGGICTSAQFVEPKSNLCCNTKLVEGTSQAITSFVPEGVKVVDWVLQRARGPVAFYDIDTPVTLEKLRDGDRARRS